MPRKSRRKDVIVSLIVLYMGFCLVYHLYSTVPFTPPEDNFLSKSSIDLSFHLRKPLNTFSDDPLNERDNPFQKLNCSPPEIEQFPRPLMNFETRKNGGLTLHVLVSLYMFLGLAIICDEYFVPSLEYMCKSLDIQADVAGATFMAAGSSAPELATAVIAVFVAKDDIGIGTVVGSAVFNIAFVVGICGIFISHAVYLNWWPMFRDCVFYLISILALLLVLWDQIVTWAESILFLVLYVVYIAFMFFNGRLESWIKSFKIFTSLRSQASEPINDISYHPLPDITQSLLENNISAKVENGTVIECHTSESSSSADEEESSIFTPSGGKFKKCVWFLSLPFLVCCYCTIPDCRRKRWRNCFFVTFLNSCLWIAFLSYILVWMITIIGFTLNIKDTIMGLTFLAAGASIPDAISSLLVVREGLGDMAVSNAVGSNVFDILLCLGLPWFIKTAITDPGSKVAVRSKGLLYSTLSLLFTVVFLLVATHLNHWKLDRKYGFILLVWYVVFMVVAVMYESALFGNSSLPLCPTDY